MKFLIFTCLLAVALAEHKLKSQSSSEESSNISQEDKINPFYQKYYFPKYLQDFCQQFILKPKNDIKTINDPLFSTVEPASSSSSEYKVDQHYQKFFTSLYPMGFYPYQIVIKPWNYVKTNAYPTVSPLDYFEDRPYPYVPPLNGFNGRPTNYLPLPYYHSLNNNPRYPDFYNPAGPVPSNPWAPPPRVLPFYPGSNFPSAGLYGSAPVPPPSPGNAPNAPPSSNSAPAASAAQPPAANPAEPEAANPADTASAPAPPAPAASSSAR
ncbi:PREDICTED: protein transport protein SEC31-like [Elephantulus edwardii]|uniref:protein transport protein SEC31-like n=1 Tax=Elephantulus edwardii TaxID=28737 RepID=UPI0003F06BF2|nr:PREDICTED: protein transport protein SEC31-like [Elephantulus edwardii]